MILLLSTGPIANIVSNGRDVGRSVSCSIQLAVNQTKAHLELRLKPVADILMDLKVRQHFTL